MDFGSIGLFAATSDGTLEVAGRIALNILYVFIGINALVLVHEFGHFIVARMCGVRCEKFYIWFDCWGLKFFSFKWGTTEYGLGVLPLGGYVKMLGQEDNPGELRAEMERAKSREQGGEDGTNEKGAGDGASAQSPDAAPQTPTRSVKELSEQIYAPDSYLAKSVPQRLAIICAGVAMNFLFAIVCATTAYMVGVEEAAPSVGNIVPGSPAWTAGLETGDKILTINGEPARVFTDISMAMVGSEDGVTLSIDRNGETIEKTVVPRKRDGDLAPMIGVGSLPTLNLASETTPVDPALGKYYVNDILEALKQPNLRIVGLDGRTVNSYAEYMDAQLKFFDRSVHMQFMFEDGGEKSVLATIPAIPMKEIGVRFKMGKITTILPGSDAEKKGIVPGDSIRSVDDVADFDPLKLPQIILRKVNAEQKTVKLDLVTASGEEKSVEIELLPERIIPNLGFLSMKDPVASTALGLAWEVDPTITAIAPAAAEAAPKLPIGGKIVAVKLLNALPILNKNSFSASDPEGVQFGGVGEKVDIPYIFSVMLQASPPMKDTKAEGKPDKEMAVRLQIEDAEGGTKTFDVPVYDSQDWFSTDRGFVWATEKALVKIDDFGEAVKLGTDKMIESSMAVFRFLQALGSGNVSPRALGGPVLIVKLAYLFADSGLGSYLMFLCLIGANLAVINILPIPVLDGGHVVFLLYEGITGRQPNETFQVIVSYMGLALILTLFVWVLALDFSCIARL